MLGCPHCGQSVFRPSQGTKLKARTTMLVLHKSGEVEINCGNCRAGVLIPLKLAGEFKLRKAERPRFVIKAP